MRKLRSYRPLIAVAVVVVGALALGACGDSDDGDTSSNASGNTTATGDNAKKPVELAMVETYSSIPVYQFAKQGGEDAAADDGAIKLTVRAPVTSNGTAEAGIAQQLLATDQDGYVLNPCILPAWTRVLKLTADQQPNVLTFNCKPISSPDQTSPIKTFIGPNDKDTGRAIADTAITKGELTSSSSGTVLIGNCFKGTPILDDRNAGYIEMVKQKIPNAKIVTFSGTLDQAKNTATWTSEVQKHPDTILAFGPCDVDSASLLTLQQKNPGKYAIGVVDPDRASLEAIKSGLFAGGANTQFWVQGYTSVALSAQGARGTALPEGWIDSGNLVVTQDNVDELLEAESSPEARATYFRPIAEKLIDGAAANVKPMADSFK